MAGATTFEQWGIAPTDLKAALEEQRPFLLWQLNGRRWALDELEAQVAYEMVRSLRRWDECGRPRLAAWAHTVARNVFLAWCRSPDAGTGPGGTTIVSANALAEDGVEFVGVERDELDGAAQARQALVCRLQEFVLSRPGGADTWRELVTDDYQIRGRTAAARLQQYIELFVDPDGELRRAAGLRRELLEVGHVA